LSVEDSNYYTQSTFDDVSSLDDGQALSPQSSNDTPTHSGQRPRVQSKQRSTSSLFLGKSSSSSHHKRKSAVSSSFSSFAYVEDELLSLPNLPDAQYRNEIKRYDPKLVAEQLMTTMCRCGYFQVNASALRTLEGRKKDEAVQRLVRFFEVLSHWPVSEILTDSKRTASDRIDDFGFFVAVAKACREVGNYHAVFALVGGLQSPLLHWVTEIAHRKDKHVFHSLKRLVRTDNNYKIYHADLSKRSTSKPCIPYLGLLNRALLSLQSDLPVFVDTEQKRINFLRCRKIWFSIHRYLKWQHSKSNNSLSPVVIDPCIRRALSESMSRSVLKYSELSSMSSLAKSCYVKSVRQRAFHRARILGHHIVGQE